MVEAEGLQLIKEAQTKAVLANEAESLVGDILADSNNLNADNALDIVVHFIAYGREGLLLNIDRISIETELEYDTWTRDSYDKFREMGLEAECALREMQLGNFLPLKEYLIPWRNFFDVPKICSLIPDKGTGLDLPPPAPLFMEMMTSK